MPAPNHSSHTSNHKSATPLRAEIESSCLDDICGSLASIESGEKNIRNAGKKWFGPLEMLDPKARAIELSRQEAIFRSLFRLHRLSCNLVPESQRLPVTEQDVFSAILILNRLTVMVKSPPSTIIAYCEARSVREKNSRLNQLDPLQLRHLLSFHEDMPHEELTALDIQTLKTACEKSDKNVINAWFKRIATRKHALPNAAPQFLRQMINDLWTAGHRMFLETFATELSVLDTAMFDVLGWENSRLFLAIFKRLHGSACRFISPFIDAEEIDAAIEMYRLLNDPDQIIHFRALATVFDAKALRRLERTTLTASKERGSRFENIRPASITRDETVPSLTMAEVEAMFARKNLGIAG